MHSVVFVYFVFSELYNGTNYPRKGRTTVPNNETLPVSHNRIEYLDYLRVIATAAVVLLHISIQGWGEVDVQSGQWMIYNVWNGLVRWCVPVFVMISGALFLNPKKKVTVYRLWTRNIPRILSAFLFWSVLYALYHLITRSGWTGHTFLMAVLTGNYHMWFLFLIIGLYLVTPLLRKISADRGMLNYFLVLALFFGFLIPTLRHQVIPFSVSLTESDTISALLKDYDSMRLYLPLGYTGYFALGYYLYKRNLTPGERIVIYVLGALGFLMTISGTAVLSRNLGKANSSWYEYVSVNVLLESMAVFVLVRYSSRYWKEKVCTLLQGMADKTFGIYLIHLLLVEFLADVIGLKSTLFTPVLSVPILAAFAFAVSYFAARGLKRLGRFSRYII